eukprot:c11323_g1_i1 orf=89-1048(+)
MATQQEEEEDLAFSAAYEDDTPTPPGWKRKLVPRIGKGLIPARTDVIFITPGGEEFKSRAQLQRYLKANKGTPSLSEFIWIVDELPQRSTRSKSTPLVKVKKIEVPSKAASKRKLVTEAPLEELEAGKCRHTEKIQKPVEELRVVKVKGKRSKKAYTVPPPSEEKNEGKAFTGSTAVSHKKKRSVKNTQNSNRVPADETQSVKTNGVTETGKNVEKVEETTERVLPHKASKEKGAKVKTARGRRSKGTVQDMTDDSKEVAGGGNGIDGLHTEATEAQSDADVGDEANHHAGEASVEHAAQDHEKEAVINQENHLVEINA